MSEIHDEESLTPEEKQRLAHWQAVAARYNQKVMFCADHSRSTVDGMCCVIGDIFRDDIAEQAVIETPNGTQYRAARIIGSDRWLADTASRLPPDDPAWPRQKLLQLCDANIAAWISLHTPALPCIESPDALPLKDGGRLWGLLQAGCLYRVIENRETGQTELTVKVSCKGYNAAMCDGRDLEHFSLVITSVDLPPLFGVEKNLVQRCERIRPAQWQDRQSALNQMMDAGCARACLLAGYRVEFNDDGRSTWLRFGENGHGLVIGLPTN